MAGVERRCVRIATNLGLRLRPDALQLIIQKVGGGEAGSEGDSISLVLRAVHLQKLRDDPTGAGAGGGGLYVTAADVTAACDAMTAAPAVTAADAGDISALLRFRPGDTVAVVTTAAECPALAVDDETGLMHPSAAASPEALGGYLSTPAAHALAASQLLSLIRGRLRHSGRFAEPSPPGRAGGASAHGPDASMAAMEPEHACAIISGPDRRLLLLRRIERHLHLALPALYQDINSNLIERGILLISTFELIHRPETPYRVIINEAIELAKGYGGTDGHKFVNGVLDKLAARVRADEVEANAQQRRAARNGDKG